MNSKTQQWLANIDRAEREGLMTSDEARDERIRARLTAVVDSRRARLNAPR